MTKPMNYEDRNGIEILTLKLVESLGIKLTEEQENKFLDEMDNILEPYTTGTYANYN